MTDNLDDFMKLFSASPNDSSNNATGNSVSSNNVSANVASQLNGSQASRPATSEDLQRDDLQHGFVQRDDLQRDFVQRDAAQYLDRFASNDPEDAQFENEHLAEGASDYLKQMPDEQFQQAAHHAWTQVDDVQRQGLAGGLIQALQNRGLDGGALGSLAGLRSADPRRMEADDYVRLANFARTRHPDAMRDIVRQQPWLLKALGSPVVLSVLSIIALRMLQNRS